jgi:CubicO group peptidase (beta-lactamase class C family)
MQRMLVIVAVTVLVTASLGVGSLAAHWPFWQRAWQWHHSGSGWPDELTGAQMQLHGGSAAQLLDVHPAQDLAAAVGSTATRALLRAGPDGRVDAWFAPGVNAESVVDWRGLTPMVLVPLYAQLAAEHAGLLDAPIGAWLPDWSADRRGAITARQLFWQLAGMPAETFTPLNPFSARAQLASGPDFGRAAMRWQPVWPPGSHFEESPVNAQLLAVLVAHVEDARFADVLQKRLWSRLAADDAIVMLDHRAGDMSAHCCLRATLADWLRLSLLLASDGRVGGAAQWPPGFAAQMTAASPVHSGFGLGFEVRSPRPNQVLLVATSTGRQVMVEPGHSSVLLWVGEGEPPPDLARLLP